MKIKYASSPIEKEKFYQMDNLQNTQQYGDYRLCKKLIADANKIRNIS